MVFAVLCFYLSGGGVVGCTWSVFRGRGEYKPLEHHRFLLISSFLVIRGGGSISCKLVQTEK